jgi:hypothetical protein
MWLTFLKVHIIPLWKKLQSTKLFCFPGEPMRDLKLREIKNVNGGAWCTWNGYPGNGAANQIWIEGDDCSVLKQSIQIDRGSFDVSGMIMTAAFAWSGFVVSYTAATVFGLGAIASGGVCLIFGLALGAGYAATQG